MSQRTRGHALASSSAAAIALDVRTAEENLQRARLTLARTRGALVQTQIDMQHLTGRLEPDA